jgi:hypothetical protein
MLQGGVDGNHETCMLWYYQAKYKFVECSGQRKITEWMVAKESGDKGKAKEKKPFNFVIVPDGDGTPAVGDEGGAPPGSGGSGGDGVDGDVGADAVVEELEGDSLTSLRCVPNFNDYVVDSWQISDEGALSVTIRGRTVTPPVLSNRYLSLPQMLFLDTPRVKAQLKLNRVAACICRVITGSSTKTVAECVEGYEKDEGIDADWYLDNSRVIILDVPVEEFVVMSLVGKYLDLNADGVFNATDRSILSSCAPMFDSKVVQIQRGVLGGKKIGSYLDHVEDFFPEVLKLEEEDKNTGYFGGADYYNFTAVFFPAEMVKESLLIVDLNLSNCAKAHKDLVATIPLNAHWSLRAAFAYRAKQLGVVAPQYN